MTSTTRIVRRFVPDDEIDYVMHLLRGDDCRLVDQTRQPSGTWTVVADCPQGNLIGDLGGGPVGDRAEREPA